MKKSDRLQRIESMLQQNDKISVKVSNLEYNTFRNMDHLIHYTLQYYHMEMWFDYFSLLTRGLMYFAIDSCKLENCSVRLIKKDEAFVLQIYSDFLKTVIDNKEFVDFTNNLSEKMPDSPFYSDLLFLKKLFEIKQIDTENITYSSDRLELFIPDSNLTEEKWIEIRDAVITSIEALPPLKENLLKLEEMIHSGDFDMNSIADQVSTDPALTMDILKIVNSGAYVLNTKIDDISSALKYLGLRELYNLLITLSIKNVLTTADDKMKDFWYHSNKCAFYACHIANKLNIKVAHTDSIYTAALLHDIGKFPISLIFGDENQFLLDYCTRYKIFLSDIEDALSGIRHCETGFLMADKWNLPDSLKLVMKHHHEPEKAPEKFRNINDIVYLCDCLVYSESGRFNLSDTNKEVLKRHGLSSHEDLKERFAYLSERFESGLELLP